VRTRGAAGAAFLDVAKAHRLFALYQQPQPGAQLGLHIEHVLTRDYQLLGKQIAQAAGALNRPDPFWPSCRPCH